MNDVDTLVNDLRQKLTRNVLRGLAARFAFPLADPLPTANRAYHTQGYLTRTQANKIVDWKTDGRDGNRFLNGNTNNDVVQLTKLAAHIADNYGEFPEVAACSLMSMNRVSYPVASAILTAWDQDEFGIIDFRCWSALHKLTGMKKFDRGKRTLFKPDEFRLYIQILRRWRDLEGVSPRLIDKALWQFDKENPKALYRDGMKGITFTDHQYIVRKEGILSREPVVNGTRTPVRAIVGNSRLGYTPKKILEALPHLSLKAIHDALSYYDHHTEEIEEHIEQNRVPEHLIHPSVRGL